MLHTFRPRSNYVWAAISFLLILLFATNSILVLTNVMQTLVELTLCLVLATISYLIWIRPKMVLDQDCIRVINPLGREEIAYDDILDFETKWALTIVHRGGKTRVWVAPASGKRRWIADNTFGWYGRGVPMSGSSVDGAGTMSESLDSVSGQAAYLIRERMKRRH